MAIMINRLDPKKELFISEINSSLDQVKCTNVRSGSIIVTLVGQCENLDSAVNKLQKEGLTLSSFGKFNVQPEQQDNQENMQKLEFYPGIFGFGHCNDRISEIHPGTQASAKGVCIGWRIVEVNGEKKVKNAAIDDAIKKTKKNGVTVILFNTNGEVNNDQKEAKTENTKKVFFEPGILGIYFKGNLVTEIKPDSQADKAGVCPGWRILEVNGEAQPNKTSVIDKAIDKFPSPEILFKMEELKEEKANNKEEKQANRR